METPTAAVDDLSALVEKSLFVSNSPFSTPRRPRALPETPIKASNKHAHVTVGNFTEFIRPGRNIANDPHVVNIGSPRSLKSCAQCGIDPAELYPVPFDAFERTNLPIASHNALGSRVEIRPKPSERRRIARQRFEAFEAQRKQKLQLVKTQREVLIAEENAQNETRKSGSFTLNSHDVNAATKIGDFQKAHKSEFLTRKAAAEYRRRATLERAKAIAKANEVAVLKAQIAKEHRRNEALRTQRIEEQQQRERIEQKRTQLRVTVEHNVRQQIYYQKSLQQKCDASNDVCYAPSFGRSLREIDKKEAKGKAQQKILVHDAKLAYLTPRQRNEKVASSQAERSVV